MTFQIIDKETSKAINLAQFDKDYCIFNNIECDQYQFAAWFYALEGAFCTYGDLADNSDNNLRLHRALVKDYRTLSMHQTVQMLTIYAAKTFYDNEEYKDWEQSLEWLKPIVKFFLSVKDKYYFEFRF